MNNNFPRFDLKGQVALVTGAARGIGHACALALAHAGADVALGLRDIQTGSELASEIEAMGRRALCLQMDVTHLDEIQQAIDATVSHFGRLDILVNNAGLGPSNLAENVREEDFDLHACRQLERHVFCQPGRRSSDDRTKIWSHYQPGFTGRLGRSAH